MCCQRSGCRIILIIVTRNIKKKQAETKCWILETRRQNHFWCVFGKVCQESSVWGKCGMLVTLSDYLNWCGKLFNKNKTKFVFYKEISVYQTPGSLIIQGLIYHLGMTNWPMLEECVYTIHNTPLVIDQTTNIGRTYTHQTTITIYHTQGLHHSINVNKSCSQRFPTKSSVIIALRLYL